MKFFQLLIAFLVFLTSVAQANETSIASVEATSPPSAFSMRIRPFGLAFGIVGAEAFYDFSNEFYVGVSGQYYTGYNDDKQTALTNGEYSLIVGKFFGRRPDLESGFYAQAAAMVYDTTVSTIYSVTNQNLQGRFYQLAGWFGGGYQFRMTFVDPTHFNVRFGVGVAYKPASTIKILALDGAQIPVGVRERFDPSLEATIGYIF